MMKIRKSTIYQRNYEYTHTPHHTRARARTHAPPPHTHILIPFEDREPTGLKADITVCQMLIWPSSLHTCSGDAHNPGVLLFYFKPSP